MSVEVIDQPNITPKSWLMIATLGFTWGATFMLIEVALTGMTPFWLAFARLLIAAVVMSVVWVAMRCPLALDHDHRPKVWHYLWSGLISSALPFSLLSWGQTHVTSSFAGTSMATVPLVVLPLAHFLVPGEQLRWRTTLGMGLGFAGVWFLIGQDAFDSSGSSLELMGRLACVAVAACYAINSVSIRRLPPVDPIGLTTMMMVSGAVLVLPVAVMMEGWPSIPSGPALGALLAVGLLSTAAMNFLRVVVIRTAGPTFLTLVNYQVPLWSVVLGSVVLGEALPPSLLWALALILGGLALSQWPAIRRLWGGTAQTR